MAAQAHNSALVAFDPIRNQNFSYQPGECARTELHIRQMTVFEFRCQIYTWRSSIEATLRYGLSPSRRRRSCGQVRILDRV